MKISKSFSFFIFIALLFASGECLALPFQKTSTSYQNWLNSKKWKGDDMKFMRLDRCFYMNPDFILSLYRDRGVELTFNPRVYMEGYNCRYGFVEILNPQGKKVCLIDEIEFIQSHPVSTFDEPKINIKYNNCRWK
jgi:hypothetical protein